MQVPKWKIREETAGLLKQSILDSSLQDISSSGCPIFTRTALIHALINFIIADDQSINVMDMYVDRDMYLYCEESQADLVD